MKYNKSILCIGSITAIIIIYYIVNKLSYLSSPQVNNSLVILWDIHCKQNFINYINK